MTEDARGSRDGEFDLIARLLEGVPHPASPEGPGDDAAVVPVGSDALVAADMLVEGRHFDLAFSSPEDVGFKAIAVNVSDIAAMGGTPRAALLSLGLPREGAANLVDGLRAGIRRACEDFGIPLVGGDTVEADSLILSVTVVGVPGPGGVVVRSGARPGDLLCVTGRLGGASAGLALLRRVSSDPDATALLTRFPSLADAHRRGRARTAAGAAAARLGVHAMIDVSDGLASDVGHLCRASGVGVVVDIDALPLAAGVSNVAAWDGREPWTFALGGGDDYELAIAVDAASVDELRAAITPLELTVCGRFVEQLDLSMVRSGAIDPLPELGWDHFGGSS